jgi:hypothetical protein
MKIIKNILVGFVVSFLGSIPLGYLNFIGFEIYTEFGINNLLLYLLGVIFIEALVIYFTLIFAAKLANNKKLMKVIDIFGIFFLLLLAYSFYSHSTQSVSNQHYLEKYIIYSPVVIGLFLSSINFLQLPFWTGWNLYLINGKYIHVNGKWKFFYILGTLIGTFLGMLALVFFLNTISQNADSFSKYLMPVIIPMLFIVMACLQSYKVFKKYIR